MNNNLLSLLKLAYIPGTVTLASGKVSNFYIDVRKVSLSNEGSFEISKALAPYLKDVKVVAGEGIGGMAIALAALRIDNIKNCVAIRKEPKSYGLSEGNFIESPVLPTSVILLEDVITSGKSVISAANKLINAGFTIVKIIGLIDREENGIQNIINAGFSVETLFKRSDII